MRKLLIWASCLALCAASPALAQTVGSPPPFAGQAVSSYSPSTGTTVTVVPPVKVANGGSSFGLDFVETIPAPSTLLTSSVAIGMRNDTTVTGNMTNFGPSTDVLSGNFTTTWGSVAAPVTGTQSTGGGFQVGNYVSAYAAGASWTNLRSLIIHQQNNSADTIAEWDAVQPIMTNNVGHLLIYADIHCEDLTTTPGGGSISLSYCVDNNDTTKAIYTVGPLTLYGASAVASLQAGATLMIGSGGSQILANNSPGCTAVPLSFIGDTQTGVSTTSNGSGALCAVGVKAFGWNGTNFFGNVAHGPYFNNIGSTGTTPSIGPDRTDQTTGIGLAAPGVMALMASNIDVLQIKSDRAAFLLPPILPSYTVAQLNALSLPAGAEALASDANAACSSGSSPTGGGSTKCRVWWNGTAWIEG